ncbi:VOC family protein [Shimazuella sp. AN120528]|uniref:VOC family protein n=1 Tax=Shimazuella soli TaxID=1892854 RepID=UPI001F10D045|nr:VOC family protein [Shimazuella soli]MCH5583974.1 VOC family protein [Shimazuella soli]
MGHGSKKFPWRGFHHIAIVTPDLDTTIHFYQDILGMEIGKIYPAKGGRGRHGFIKPGICDGLGLHFFENPHAKIISFPKGSLRPESLQTNSFVDGVLQHIAFSLPDEDSALILRERLLKNEVEMTDIYEIESLKDMIFIDKTNGILLEAIWPSK